MTKAEVMEIINNPTKHIQILNRNGKASIVYSAKFVELLEAIPEMFTKNKEQVIPLSTIDDIKAEIEPYVYENRYAESIKDDMTGWVCASEVLKMIDDKVKEYTE